MLNVTAKWLKALVRDRRVPHQRAGAKRGVWFTAADIVEIGRILPELMSARRFSREAGPPGGEMPTAALAASKLKEWAQLTSHQRTSRRSPRRR